MNFMGGLRGCRALPNGGGCVRGSGGGSKMFSIVFGFNFDSHKYECGGQSHVK